MTKAEELRGMIISLATYDFRGRSAYEPALEEATSKVDSLITAARAEGAEQMRQKIVAESYPCRLSEKSHCWIYRIDDPALAPREVSP